MVEGLPVHGYVDQSQDRIDMVNANKATEEQILRLLDMMRDGGDGFDQRWVSIARTHIEQGFMALNRAVFRPQRVELPANGD